MLIRIYRPPPPLSEFIDWLWFHEGLLCEHRRERVLPDGTFELIINLDDCPRKLFDRRYPNRHRAFRRAWLSGTHSEYIVIDVLPRSSMMGVHFKPGGAAPFLGMPANELKDSVVELDAVWGNATNDLREALLEQPTPEGKFRLLEEFLVRLARGRFDRSDAVAYALRRFMAGPHEVTMREVAHELGLSRKHFIARFRDEVGLTPKRFCRIQRFQRVLQRIEQQRAVEWADVATACGYYDQAHFINDFHTFGGLNPSAYLTDRGEYLNFVPIRD